MKSFKTEKPVLCAGSLMPDFVIPFAESKRYLSLIASGSQAAGGNPMIRPMLGGTSGNTAYGLAKLGVKTMILAKVGNDYQGQLLKEDMEQSGVDASNVIIDKTSPTMMNVVVSDETNRYMFIWPLQGSSLWHITPEDIPSDLPQKIGWVHFCGATMELNPAGDSLCDFAQRCRESGVTVSVDLNLRSECFGWSEEHFSHLKRAIDSAHVIFGSLRDEFPFFADQPRKLVTDDRIVIARDGKKGSTLYTSDDEYTLGIYDLPVSDTVGAGDNFDAGFIAAALEGLPLRQCMEWGNAVGNYSVQFPGGHAAPDRLILLQFLREKGIPALSAQ